MKYNKLDCFREDKIFEYDDGELLELAIVKYGFDVNDSDFIPYLPVMSALYNSAINCLRVLLKHGADVNSEYFYHDFFYSFQSSRTKNIAYESFQLFFLYGLKYDAYRPYASDIRDNTVRNFYFDWPHIIILYCLEKRNIFFII